MHGTNSSACGLCGGPTAGSALDFAYRVPEAQKAKYERADFLHLDLDFCQECAPKVLKHLKRFFGVSRFRAHSPESAA